MSMSVYPVTGELLTLNALDQKAASGVATAENAGLPSGTLGGVVTVTQDREVTKSGTTRAMIKVGFKTPLTDPYSAGGNQSVTMGEISAHCVVTIPKVVANILAYEAAAFDSLGGYRASSNILWLLRVLTALVNNASLGAVPEITLSSPMIQAFVGSLPLNVDSGTYGSAS